MKFSAVLTILSLSFFAPTQVEGGADSDSYDGRRLSHEQGLLKNEELAPCLKETYQVSVVVHDHVLLAAMTPIEGCPDIVFDYNSNKHAHVFDPKAKEQEHLLTGKPLLKTSLESIANAYDLVEMDQEMEYDMVMNNCASFVLEMLAYMDHFVDEDTVKFSADRLAQHSKIAQMIRDSPYAEVVVGAELLNGDDTDLVFAFTKLYTENRKLAFLEQKNV